jgi:hypothetical protein
MMCVSFCLIIRRRGYNDFLADEKTEGDKNVILTAHYFNKVMKLAILFTQELNKKNERFKLFYRMTRKF